MKQHQACDHCGGRFGLVTHRWWGNRFCKLICKTSYRHEVALTPDKFIFWHGIICKRQCSVSS